MRLVRQRALIGRQDVAQHRLFARWLVDRAALPPLQHGFVSETNATNVFVVQNGTLFTPHADSCLPGITRAAVIETGRDDGTVVVERNISLTRVYTADEVFSTGTVGGLATVLEVDGRRVGSDARGPLTLRLQALHAERAFERGEPIR